MPCITDEYAYRNPEDGSRYIISLTNTVICMVKNGENYEIVTIFNKVNTVFADKKVLLVYNNCVCTLVEL